MKIVVLDEKSLGNSLDFSSLIQFKEVTFYPYTLQEQIVQRSKEATVIITNKCKIDSDIIKALPKLKLICMTGTGFNHIDVEAAKANEVGVCNVEDYCTDSVAQHTLALVLQMMNQLNYYRNYTENLKYVADHKFIHYEVDIHEMSSMTWGIIGMGHIGQRVAELATCFGAKVIYYSTSGMNLQQSYPSVSLESLLKQSDIITLHAPLNHKTKHLMDISAFETMKPSSILINVGRGGLVNEFDLVKALENNMIAKVALDVIAEEPMSETSPLLSLINDSRLVITPHVAWASVEARQRVIEEVVLNIKSFIDGERRQRVD